jgi:hypothetical protein
LKRSGSLFPEAATRCAARDACINLQPADADPIHGNSVPVIARISWIVETLSSPAFWEQGHSVIYKGVEYTVVETAEPDIWEWRFQIGDKVKTGKTQTRLAALAARRVQAKIDAALRAARAPSPDQQN